MMPPNEISTAPCPAHQVPPIGDEAQRSPRSDARERPILFSTPMVRALLAGTKTQTRRTVKAIKDRTFGCEVAPHEIAGEVNRGDFTNCRYGRPGDRLWVRETFAPLTAGYAYFADPIWNAPPADRWRPSIHMPRAASRILLEVTGVRVERLQDISQADAIAEGIERPEAMSDEAMLDADVWPTGVERAAFNALNQPTTQYRRLWEQINGAGSWAGNPWVWVVEFRRIMP